VLIEDALELAGWVVEVWERSAQDPPETRDVRHLVEEQQATLVQLPQPVRVAHVLPRFVHLDNSQTLKLSTDTLTIVETWRSTGHMKKRCACGSAARAGLAQLYIQFKTCRRSTFEAERLLMHPSTTGPANQPQAQRVDASQ
jgi:hypothetical protein